MITEKWILKTNGLNIIKQTWKDMDANSGYLSTEYIEGTLIPFVT